MADHRPLAGDAVYGTLAVGALLSAESARHETYAKTVGAVALTLVLYWLAHAYAELVGERLHGGHPLSAGALVRTMVGESPMLLGAAVPLAALLVCWGLGIALTSAVLAAVWTSAAIIVAVEVVAALRTQSSGLARLAQAVVGALLGLLLIVLRIVLH